MDSLNAQLASAGAGGDFQQVENLFVCQKWLGFVENMPFDWHLWRLSFGGYVSANQSQELRH